MFRFTIRELLLLMLVIAMGVGWWADHHRLAKSVLRTRFTLMMLWDAVRSEGYDVGLGSSLIDQELDQLEGPIATTGPSMRLKTNVLHLRPLSPAPGS
jgi:hypothetical protein